MQTQMGRVQTMQQGQWPSPDWITIPTLPLMMLMTVICPWTQLPAAQLQLLPQLGQFAVELRRNVTITLQQLYTAQTGPSSGLAIL